MGLFAQVGLRYLVHLASSLDLGIEEAEDLGIRRGHSLASESGRRIGEAGSNLLLGVLASSVFQDSLASESGRRS